MNKRGFTLIEIIAVVFILSILIIIVGSSITKSVRDSKEKLYNSQINSIISSTEMWIADNIEKIDPGCQYVTLSTLQAGGYVDLDIKNPRTNNEFSGSSTYITINATGTSGNFSYSYEVVYETPSSCTLIS